MLVIVGRVKRVRTRIVPYTDKKTGEDTSFTEVTLAIASEDDVDATWCELGRDFGDIPAEGEAIAAEAYVRTYVSSASRTGAGYSVRLMRRVGLADVMPDAASDGRPVRLAAAN